MKQQSDLARGSLAVTKKREESKKRRFVAKMDDVTLIFGSAEAEGGSRVGTGAEPERLLTVAKTSGVNEKAARSCVNFSGFTSCPESSHSEQEFNRQPEGTLSLLLQIVQTPPEETRNATM